MIGVSVSIVAQVDLQTRGQSSAYEKSTQADIKLANGIFRGLIKVHEYASPFLSVSVAVVKCLLYCNLLTGTEKIIRP